MQVEKHAPIKCPRCGKQFAWKAELSGRHAKCKCGEVIHIPAEIVAPPEASHAVGDSPGDLYGLAPEPTVADSKPSRATAAPWMTGKVVVEHEAEDGTVTREVLSSGGDVENVDESPPDFDHFGAADFAQEESSAGPSSANTRAGPVAPPLRHKRVDEDDDDTPTSDPMEPSILLDWILPAGLIALGLYLSFLEVTKYSEKPVSDGPAILTAIGFKVALSAGLILVGMYLATVAGEINFPGHLGVVALKLISIAIGAGAIYGVVTHAVGGMEGAAAGSFAAIAAYAVLFKVVMRLDAKDTAICTMITWILVAAANYAAWRLDGMMRDAWV